MNFRDCFRLTASESLGLDARPSSREPWPPKVPPMILRSQSDRVLKQNPHTVSLCPHQQSSQQWSILCGSSTWEHQAAGHSSSRSLSPALHSQDTASQGRKAQGRKQGLETGEGRIKRVFPSALSMSLYIYITGLASPTQGLYSLFKTHKI